MNELQSTFRPVQWFVIFQKSTSDRWWLRFLDPNFAHITLVRYSWDRERFISADSNCGNLVLDNYPILNLREVYKDAVILRCWSKRIEKPTARIWHLNCVEFAKSVLGIQSWRVITPKQLYNHIIKINERQSYGKRPLNQRNKTDEKTKAGRKASAGRRKVKDC